MFEQLGLGVRFEFENYGHANILNAMSDMNGLYDIARQSGEVFSSLQQNFETTTTQIQSYAKTMVKVGTAMTGAFGLGINAAKDFESELAGLKKYMSDTSQTGIAEFNSALSDSAKELGVAKTEIMKAAQEYMAMGLAQDKALEMASAVTKAGKIWDVASQEAAAAFKGISAAYNMDFLIQDTRDEFVDMINYVADNTALVGRDSLNFLSAAGASLKTMGNTDMQGALGIASAAAKAQVDITHLGYGMNTMIRRYADKGETYFKMVGLEAKDATGQLRPFNEMLDELAQKMKEGKVEQTAIADFASKLGGVYASDLLRIVNAWDEYDKTMSAINSKQYAGSAQREWETITATFEHQANITKVIWSDFIQSTFGQILPIVTKFVAGFNKAFSAITTFLSNHPKIAAFGTALFGLTGIALVLGGSFILLSTKISQWMISIQTAQRAGYSFSGMLNVMRLHLANATSAIPMLLKNLVGIGLTFGLVYLTMKYDILGIRSMFEKFVSTIRNSFNESKNLMQSSANVISASLHSFDNSDSLADHLTALFTRIGIGWQALKEMWSSYELSDEMYDKLVASGMLPVVTSIMMLVYRLREAWRGFKDGFNGMCEIIRNTIQNVLAPPFNWLKDHVIIPAIDFIQQFMIKVGLMSSQSSLLTSASSKWYAFGKAIGSAGPFLILIGLFQRIVKYAGILKTVFSPIGKLITGPFKLLGKVIGKIPFSSIIGGFQNIGIALSNLVRGNLSFARFIAEAFPRLGIVIGTIGDAFSVVGGVVSSVFSAIAQAVTGFVSAVGAPVIAIIVAVVASVVAFAVKFKTEFMNIITTVKTTFFNVVGGIADKFRSVIDGIKQRIQIVGQFLQPAIERAKTAVGHLVEAFVRVKEGISAIAQNEKVQAFFGVLVDILASVGAVVTSVVIPAFNFLQVVLGSVAQFIIGTLGAAFNGLVDIVGGVIAGVIDVFSGIVDVVSGVINTVAGLISGIITGDFSQFFDGLSQIGTGILEMFGGVLEAIGSFFVGIGDFLAGTVSSFFDAGCNIVQGLIDGVISIGQNIWSSLTSVFQSIIDGVKALFGIASPSTVMMEIGNNIVQGLINGIQALIQGVVDIFTGIADAITGIVEGIGNFLSGAWEGITSVASSAWEGLKGVASTVWEGISTTVTGVVDGIGTTLGTAWDGITTAAGTAWDTISSAASTAWEGISTTIGTVAEGIGTTLSGVWDGITTTASTAWDTISSAASTAWEGISTTVGGLAEGLGTTLDGVWEGIGTAASTAWDGIKSAASTAWEGIKGFFGGLWDDLTGKSETGASNVSTATNGCWDDMTQGVGDAFNGIPETVSSAWEGIRTTVETSITSIKTTVTTGWTSIAQGMVTSVTGIGTALNTVWNGLTTGVTTMMNNLRTSFSTGWTTIHTNVTTIARNLSTVLTTTFTTLLTQLNTKITTFANTAKAIFQTFTTGITTLFSTLRSALSSAMTSIASNLVNGFKNAKSSVTSTISSLCSSVTSKFSGLASGAFNYGANMISGFVRGIRSKISAVASAASDAVKAAKNYIGFHSPAKMGEGRHIVEWGANMIGGFIDGVNSAVPALQNTMAKVIQAPNLITTVDAVGSGNITGTNVSPVMPTNDYDSANRSNIDNIYNSRSEVNNQTNNNTTNGGGVSLAFNEGAFKFAFEGVTNSDDVIAKMPEIQGYIERTVLDLVKKLKNQQYER